MWLQQVYKKKSQVNPRYSLRAFAKFLKINSSTLAQILSGKRIVSQKYKEKIYQTLGEKPFYEDTHKTDKNEHYQIQQDIFEIISDLLHYKIMELTFVKGFQSETRWIAKMLKSDATLTQAAIDRLLRVQLLEKNLDGTLRKTHQKITNDGKLKTSLAHKQLQKQIIEEALGALENYQAEEKDITSMTMCIDIEKLPQARELIKKFRRDLCAYLTSENPSRIYNLAIQLFPTSETTQLSIVESTKELL